MTTATSFPIPSFFNAQTVGDVWRVPYQDHAATAKDWRNQHQIKPAATDKKRICLMAIDVQNTFCIPNFELFVGGQSGMGAVEDNQRLCKFIYRNLGVITEIAPTLDTHTAMQIFHPIFWINDAGEHPQPASPISYEEVQQGIWKVNPAIAYSLSKGNYLGLQQYALHYTKTLSEKSKYPLTIWPYHAMVGGISYALVSAVEEAVFFHNMVRHSQTNFEIKGGNPLTENYSVLRPEVLQDSQSRPIAQKNTRFLQKLLNFDAVIIAGQAKSHCVAWTIDDLLSEILTHDPSLAKKVYLLEDCTSPVVIPGVVDFTPQADEAFARFEQAGMNIVTSDKLIADFPGLSL